MFWYRRGKKLFNFHMCIKGKKSGGDERHKEEEGGGHDEEINMRKSERKREKSRGEGGGDKKGGTGTTLISYENTASNLAVLFIQTMSASNYPTQATN